MAQTPMAPSTPAPSHAPPARATAPLVPVDDDDAAAAALAVCVPVSLGSRLRAAVDVGLVLTEATSELELNTLT